MNADVSSARATEPCTDAAGTGTSALASRLSRQLEADRAIRCAAFVRRDPAGGARDARVRSLVRPLGARLPPGALALAGRALASGRVTRAPVPGERAGEPGETDELLAVPLGGAGSDVLVLALGGADARRRGALVRDVRARWSPRTAPADERRADAPGETDWRGPLDRATLDALARHGDACSVALAAVDTAATLFGCRRVSLGIGVDGDVTPLAISGESRPDGRREATRRLRAVMVEASLGGITVRPDERRDGEASGSPSDEPLAQRWSHEKGGGMSVSSVVHVLPGGGCVVVVLERPDDRPFVEKERARAARALEPALALVAALDGRPGDGVARLRAMGRRALAAASGGRVSPRVVLVALALAALAAASLVPLPYRVGGRVLVEASDRQVLVAPEAGYIRTAHARAGDTVAAGELLATLDDRELVLALDRHRSEAAKNRAEQSRALAEHDRVELARLRADATRVAAELALVEGRRSRGEIRAPFAGVVLSGDPTRSLGAPVAAGDVLFEIGAGERALSIEIDERDVALVSAGARVRVRMAAAPRDVREARLEPLVPVAVDADGRQVFRVPAALLDDGDVPSPGMRGVARIDAGRRTLLGAWTRGLRERGLLLAWRFGLVR